MYDTFKENTVTHSGFPKPFSSISFYVEHGILVLEH